MAPKDGGSSRLRVDVPTRVAIGLGSNLGDRAGHLNAAVADLAEIGEIVATSSVYETAPVGGPDQGAYLNAVVVLDTDLPPRSILDRLLVMEQAQGRRRRERWGPRTLDLDILLYGDQVIDSPGLTVPHPRVAERRFVLEPLDEAWPGATLPDGRRIADLLANVSHQDVKRWRGPLQGSLVVFVAVGVLAAAVWLGIDRLL